MMRRLASEAPVAALANHLVFHEVTSAGAPAPRLRARGRSCPSVKRSRRSARSAPLPGGALWWGTRHRAVGDLAGP
eukprot:1748096-Lingulodinium_polyedra.AAC.1